MPMPPRHLFLRQVNRLLAAQDPSLNPPDPVSIDRGQEQLYSFWVPGLEAGDHAISVTQTITSPPVDSIPAASMTLTSTKEFEVVVPRFSLPEGAIHSTYPPQGHGDEPRIVPHVVFRDAHLPWERVVGPDDSTSDPEWNRNRVPWLALWSFSSTADGNNELHLSADDLHNLFPKTMSPAPIQSATYTTNMLMSDLWQMAPTVITSVAPHEKTEPVDAATRADMVFVPVDLFASFVTKYDTNGQPGTQTAPDVSRYKYLAHVRHVNTTGMAETADVEEHIFSVVLGHRSAPLAVTKPTTNVVHLVTLENIVAGIPWPIPAQARFVAVPSLYSWSYQAYPPESITTGDRFMNLGSTLNVLRGPDASQRFANPTKSQELLLSRMKDGYCLTRYRTQTGESTVALYRGPFTPVKTGDPMTSFMGGFDNLSSFGSDLQIMDRQLGIMDISYSVAWQLGKTMAIGDRAFASALTRVRGVIHDKALGMAKQEFLGNLFKGRAQLLESLKNSVDTLHRLGHGQTQPEPQERWNRRRPQPLDLSFDNPAIRKLYEKHTQLQARVVASAQPRDKSGQGPSPLYDETNPPNSPDWAVVLKWVLDKTHLYGIPAHYLIPDPSFLPREQLNFFYVDQNWVHCFLDGALSVGNHIEPGGDSVRAAIKATVKQYFQDAFPSLGLLPQIPTYGFLMRSVLVTQFPDLVVTAPRPETDKIPILRQENIAKDTLLCLFDREPAEKEFETLRISQPPHQQFFSVAATLDANHIEFRYPKVYAPKLLPDTDPSKELARCVFPNPCGYFDWKTRMLIVPNFAQQVFDTIKSNMHTQFGLDSFQDTIRSAALLALQMNEKMYQMEIHIQSNSTLKSGSMTGQPTSTGQPLHALAAPTVSPPQRPLTTIAPASKTSQATLRRGAAPATPPEGGSIPTPVTKTTAPAPQSAPHIRPLRLPASVGPPRAGSGPSPQRQFSLTVYPLTNFNAAIPTQQGYQVDLVFSVQRRHDYMQGLSLHSIELTIPMGKPVAGSQIRLMETYQGEGATMLSNQRFNVWMAPTASAAAKGEINMLVRLVPRSINSYVDIAMNKEISFIVNGVDVNPYQRNASLLISGMEYWMGRAARSFTQIVPMSPSPLPPPGVGKGK